MTGRSMITPLGSWTGSAIRVSIRGSNERKDNIIMRTLSETEKGLYIHASLQ